MTSPLASDAHLIGLDWGTTSLRAFLFDAAGRVVDQRQSPHGITHLPSEGPAGFAQALADIAQDWLIANPQAPLIACGMVGSAQGWKEALYVQVPAEPTQLTQLMARIHVDENASHMSESQQAALRGRTLHILPGLIERGEFPALPNVMRGEETQIFGALLDNTPPDQLLVLLPGTHSKWVQVQHQKITHFDTFMTGEVFAALRSSTILGRTMEPAADFQAAAFAQGLQVARSPSGKRGVLSTIFSTRTLGLEKQLHPTEQADYLSGLLIGHEVEAAQQIQRQSDMAHAPIWLIGEPHLCKRYTLALEAFGVTNYRILEQATQQGLWHLAIAQRLIQHPAH